MRGGSLLLRGEPGVGKSSLIEDSIGRAEGMQILSTQGIESESPLPFAAVHRLLRPAMGQASRLPAPQARALRGAFGEAEHAGERFLVFVAVLTLLSELAEQAPVLCVVDDAHWLDDASAAALAFVARRIEPESIAMLFAARDGDVRRFDSVGIPDLVIEGLDAEAAGELLDERASTSVPREVRDALMRQTGGNALALIELPRALSMDQLSGRASLPATLPLTADVQRVFLDRSRHLGSQAQTLLLVAAADDSTRSATVRAAAEFLGAGSDAVEEAERSGLLTVLGSHIQFRHPLVRSAIYQGATSAARRRTHSALAQAMTGDEEVDRRAWHRARAIDHPDSGVVADLVDAAERARRRGGYEAASAAFERAGELTAEGADRAPLLFASAVNAWLAGQMARAADLAGDARHRTSDAVLRADIDRLRGRVELNVGSVAAAIRIWTNAARDVAAADDQRAREIGMQAAAASTFVRIEDRTDLDPTGLTRVGGDADDREHCLADLLAGFHALLRGDVPTAAARLSAALAAGVDLTETDLLTNLGIAALHLGDNDAFRRSFTRLLAQSRDDSAAALVLFALPRLALADLASSDWTAASDNAGEAIRLARSLGQNALTAMPLAELALIAAQRGDDAYDDLVRKLDAVMSGRRTTGVLGLLVEDFQRWAQGCRDALAERPAAALHHLELMNQPSLTRLAAYDRLEVAARAERPEVAAKWLTELARFAAEIDSPGAQAVVSYGRALAADPASAKAHFLDALEHQDAAVQPFETARIRLSYGAFLRRAGQRVQARDPLRAALSTFEDYGARPWADRARRELRASGESARKRDESTATDLTAQERQVARLVADGLSNRDVAARLFLSPRTIDFHLRNVFTKTGVSARGELARLNLG
jgi:DNA-binding CsgD family transcriptional regulator